MIKLMHFATKTSDEAINKLVEHDFRAMLVGTTEPTPMRPFQLVWIADQVIARLCRMIPRKYLDSIYGRVIVRLDHDDLSDAGRTQFLMGVRLVSPNEGTEIDFQKALSRAVEYTGDPENLVPDEAYWGRSDSVSDKPDDYRDEFATLVENIRGSASDPVLAWHYFDKHGIDDAGTGALSSLRCAHYASRNATSLA